MGDNRYFRYDGPGRASYEGSDDDGRSYSRSNREYSSARDYAAAGALDDERRDTGRGWRGERYGGGRDYQGGWDRGSQGAGRSDWRERSSYGGRGYGQGGERGGHDRDRGFFERAGDEVRSWFGDEEAERRRERDARARDDDHYHGWRQRQIADLDRDYDEYRRENAQRFENEFGAWRTERQGQRSSLSRVNEHMEVVGSDGAHVGTVDKVRGDRIILTKNDQNAGGHHHSIPSRWIQSVDDKVTIRKTAEEAMAHWKDEERGGALFGDSDRERGDTGPHILNRSFSGTY